MGQRYLLDSNTVIDYIAGLYSNSTTKWLNQIIDDEINVSIINKIEVLSYNPDKDDNYSTLVDFFDCANIINMNDVVVEATIKIRQNRFVKLPDAIIAATALTHDFTLITRNTKDFNKITGLKVVNPHEVE